MDSANKKHLRNNLLIIAAATAVVCVVVLFFFRHELFTSISRRAAGILAPFIWGFAIAYLLLPVSRYIERFLRKLFHPRKITKSGTADGPDKKEESKKEGGAIRLAAVLLSIVFLLLVLVFLVMAVLPELIKSISGIIKELPAVVENFQKWQDTLDTSDMSHEAVVAIETTVDTLSKKLSDFLQTDLLPYLQTLISSVTSSFMSILDFVKNFGLGCIVSAYLLCGREKFIRVTKLTACAILPEQAFNWLRKELKYADLMFSGFIHGKLLDSLIIGIICFVFVLITKMPYAVLISVIVGVTNIIPFFGPYLGAIPSALLILMVSPVKCVVFVIFIIILQQLDGNVIGPRILGDRLGLSGFWILFSILVFGSLWGFLGMLIGVPVFAVLYDIIRSFVYVRIRSKKASVSSSPPSA